MNNNEEDVRQWYKRYRPAMPATRHDPLTNPEVLFQHLAFERSVITALRASSLIPTTSKVLDVGCGNGASVAKLLPLGFVSSNLYGVDLLEERIVDARRRYAGIHFSRDDASALSFPSNTFDLVTASSMFVQIEDEALARRIADEMTRVTRSSANLMIVDWRYGKKGYKAVTQQRITSLFPSCEVIEVARGALIPPIGRAISRYTPSLYFMVQALFPVLVGSMATLLRKR